MAAPRRPARRLSWVVVALGIAVLASACQVRVGTDVAVGRDGSGRLAVTVAIDDELATSLGADDIDPFGGLEDLPGGWEATREDERQVTVTADFDDPDGLATRVAQLQEGLDDEDPIILEDASLEVDDDGRARFAARAGFRPPSSTGLRGAGVRFDGEDLAALLDERGDQVLRVDLRVTLPGPVVGGNADAVDGRTATWQLPVTELVEVRAVGDPPTDRTWWLVGAAALVGLALGWVAVAVVRRRR